tara:strand:- start:929 stop:1921 length:993 start_codon:yes stop_codon:yes gene_type:complete
MVLPSLALLSALSISSVAAYFSVIGFTAMFPGTFWPIIIMGTVLEAGKLVCACLVHRYWKDLGVVIKYYLAFAVVVLIGVTSMGIFGFLSKSHIEHDTTAMQNNSEIKLIDTKINNLNLIIERNEKYITMSEATRDITLQEMNELSARVGDLDERLNVIDKAGGFSRSKKIEVERAGQAEERALILKRRSELSIRASENQDEKLQRYSGEIDKAGEARSQLNIDKTKLLKEHQLIEAEVGPVKYVAELFGDIFGMDVVLSSTIRILILILVCVFDPLAVLLLLASGAALRKHRELNPMKKEKIIVDNLLSDLEDYVSRGGSVQKFIELKQ